MKGHVDSNQYRNDMYLHYNDRASFPLDNYHNMASHVFDYYNRIRIEYFIYPSISQIYKS